MYRSTNIREIKSMYTDISVKKLLFEVYINIIIKNN